jgi:hypothetical protein
VTQSPHANQTATASQRSDRTEAALPATGADSGLINTAHPVNTSTSNQFGVPDRANRREYPATRTLLNAQVRRNFERGWL